MTQRTRDLFRIVLSAAALSLVGAGLSACITGGGGSGDATVGTDTSSGTDATSSDTTNPGDTAEPTCGDGICNGDEDTASCETDCPATGPVCGDGTCEAPEDEATCATDCATTPVGGWIELAGNCTGTKTNALWFDDAANGFMGCGENQIGQNLYVTSDGGMTWETTRRFEEVRVNDVRRGPDGVLYGAGLHGLDGYGVFAIDEGGSPEPMPLFMPGNQTSDLKQSENVARTDDGQFMADALTGTQFGYMPAGGEWVFPRSMNEAAIDDPDNTPGFQVRRIKAFGNDFYAVGSLINDPARVHLPSRRSDATYHVETLLLQPESRDGELLDLHVWSESEMLVVGHDQSTQEPLAYKGEGDLYDPASWSQVDFYDFGMEYEAGINKLAVRGDTVIIVGEKVPTANGGFIAMSEDRGATWTDITPVPAQGKAPRFTNVWLFEDGRVYAAGEGAQSFVWIP